MQNPKQNIQLCYEIKGSGPSLLFIHGLGSCAQEWENQFDYFSKHFRVVRLDLRGHGQSEQCEPYTIPQLAQDVADLISQISQHPFHVVGHSMGGMVALQLTLNFPEYVKSLVLVNSCPRLNYSPFLLKTCAWFLKMVFRLLNPNLLRAFVALCLFPKPEQKELREQFKARRQQNNPEVYIKLLQAMRRWDVLDRLPCIRCPTLVIASDQDFFSLTFKEKYTRLLPEGELQLIKDSYHMAMLDQPQIFNQLLLKFLQKNQLPANEAAG
jgi:3-oxoadipate enol-lactonase